MNFLRQSVRAFAASKTSDKLINVYFVGAGVTCVVCTAGGAASAGNLSLKETVKWECKKSRADHFVYEAGKGAFKGMVGGAVVGTCWPLLLTAMVLLGCNCN